MENIIEVRNLDYSFTEGTVSKQILHNINTEFKSSEICIIMGPSGSGKTTLLKLIGAQRALQSGSIKINGNELFGAKDEELVALRRQIGFIFQTHHLIGSLTICQNVQLPLAFDINHNAFSSQKKALEMLDLVGIKDQAFKRPSQLSGGQKQRCAIARALVREPKLVLADEPTASLDKKSGREVVNIIQNMSKKMGCTVVLVTHDNRILDIADRILNLEDGYLK